MTLTFSRSLAVVPVLLLGTLAAQAQRDGNHTITTAVPILTLAPDARGSALGEAGVATSPDANAAFYNPGKLCPISTRFRPTTRLGCAK
jgi:hypothetical protein